jgi:RNA polymerase sigma-70 factor (ECF subfamily)
MSSTASTLAAGVAAPANRAPLALRPAVPTEHRRDQTPAPGSTSDERTEELAALRGSRRGPFARLRSTSESQHERRIASRLARREPAALADLHELTSRAAFSVILGVVRDRGHAEDVHQQVYAELWRRADQFDATRGSLLTWVLTIARSRALDHVRRRSDQPTDADVLVALGGGEEDPAFQDVIDRAHVGEALARIPEQERELLRLRFWEGLSQTEIAERTGQPLGTVKSRMLAGLRNLRLHLDAEGAA